MMKLLPKTKGHLSAVLCVLVWGVSFTASKRLLAYYMPVQLMFMRFVIAYGCLWLLHPRWEKLDLREELRYFFMGLTGCTLYFTAENTALTMTYASNVSTIVAFAPILTAILAHFCAPGGKKITLWTWIGFVIALLGVVLVVFNGAFILRLSPAGDLLALATAMMWAVFSVLQERALLHRSSLFITRKVMFYGIVTCLPWFLTTLRDFSPAPLFASAVNAGCLLFLAVLGSAVCYLAWCTAERELGIVAVSSYIYVIPFITLAAGAVLLGEAISPAGVMGAVLIVGGVWAASRQPS